MHEGTFNDAYAQQQLTQVQLRGLAIGFILNQAPVYNDMSYSKCSGVTNGGEVMKSSPSAECGMD